MFKNKFGLINQKNDQVLSFNDDTSNELINNSQSNLETLKTQYYTELVNCLTKEIEKKSNVSNKHSNQLYKESILINKNYNDNNFDKTEFNYPENNFYKFSSNNQNAYKQVFRLINDNTLDPKYVYSELVNLWKQYRNNDKKFNQYMINWIFDYCYLHNLEYTIFEDEDIELPHNPVAKNIIIEKYFSKSPLKVPVSIINSLVNFQPLIDNGFYKGGYSEQVHYIIPEAIGFVDLELTKKYGYGIIQKYAPINQEIQTYHPYFNLKGMPMKAIKILVTNYTTNGQDNNIRLLLYINNLARYTEYKLMKLYGYNGRLKNVFLDNETQKLVEKFIDKKSIFSSKTEKQKSKESAISEFERLNHFEKPIATTLTKGESKRPMTNIDTKYDVWKNKLLDLGKRNRLLNYRDTSRSNIKIEYPDCVALWDMFVKQEIPLVFPYAKENDEEYESEIESNVKTNKTLSDLQKALRNLRSKAKTAIEEQGVNVLYLSFGFLKWTESENSNQVFTSPLILVPVTLTVESITSPYNLYLHEDEIVLNPTLVYKLENDFGITLPDFDDTDDINDFLEEVKNKTSLQNWSVSKEVGLSLLSFLKINMYSDLSKHKDSIIENPLVKAIGGDVTAINEIPEGLSNYNFDKNEKPVDVFQIVDADASQQDAILMAKKGVSFVLQGPPGTGKSQTITNIIAESLADGKKVLFVSEKMAALDVVHRRLASAGLDDFCLVLHSHKANKKNVLEQLSKVLNLSQKKVTLTDEAYQKLDALQADKDKLNDYANQVYAIIKPLEKSIYEANGIVANLDSYDDFIFSIANIRNITKEQYNNFTYLLSQFATTIGKMSDDYKSNPWRDTNLSVVSNEFRHDVTSRVGVLLPKIKEMDSEVAQILAELHLDLPHTLNNINIVINLLDCASTAYSVPSEWILTDKIQSLYDEIGECSKLKNNLLSLYDELVSEYAVIRSNIPNIKNTSVEDLNSQSLLENEKNNLVSLITTEQPYCCWSIQQFNEIVNFFNMAKNTAEYINSIKNELLVVYEPTIFELDFYPILKRIKTEYTSFTKTFKKSYKEDKKAIMLHHREIVKKISDEEMISVIEKLKCIEDARKWYNDNSIVLNRLFGEAIISENADYSILDRQIIAFNAINNSIDIINRMLHIHNQIGLKEISLQEHYKFLYNGILSDWDLIRKSLDWAVLFKDKTTKISISEAFIKSVCQGDDFKQLCKTSQERLEDLKRNISFDYNWFVSNFNHSSVFDDMTLDNLQERFKACVNGLFLLEEWIDYSFAREKCIEVGLGDFIRVIEEHNIPVRNIYPIFKKRFFRLWLDSVLPEYPAVMNFRRKSQETTINEFAQLDKVQFEIAKARIKTKLINALPSLDHFTNGLDEISILKRELSKQRRIMPIRKLFKEIPNLLLTLKPCLMMSPLSVSLFLEAETYKFDIVIFDEASQVCTENAIGAISRAKQVIIAGDSKQLPPTNFFQAAVTDNDFDTDEDDEFDDSDAYESILDEANMLPERTLRWHYRSRHESLIAFSNAKIYKNNLITFPSNIEKATNNGVEYIYVKDGFYDRGGKKGNVIEANKIADLVFQHFKEQPQRSLGVIAFGEVQQQAIETVIRERRLQNQEFEEFFAEDKEEAFFVKNLENVQGDERDTIIFSIGYAKDNAGVFRMNFGPLSKSGGERRLNVAITRAKFNVKIVGSIMPTDIDVDKISSEGPKLLRTYIDFAINGPSVLEREATESDIIEHDSPFEEAVYNFLDRKGYRLATQVGCSGYRIDMAVKHPTLSGIYVLGIECDGAAYHSARTARERDRLRQDVLENMGWKIYRIWSTDWIKDPVTEGAKLIETVEKAIAGYGIDEDVNAVNNDNNSECAADFTDFEEKDSSVTSVGDLYGFEKRQIADFSTLPRNKNGYLKLTDCIMEVVNKEYPIHYELMCQMLAHLLGNEKATVKVRSEVDYALSKLGNQVIRKDDFFYPANYQTIPVRLPNIRKIQHISTDELSVAMYRILETCVGTNRKALSVETARVYGFNRAGQNILFAMSKAIDCLIESGKVKELEGKLIIE